jgi:hypothetical protein
MKRILTALLLLCSTYAQAANFTAPRFRAQTSAGAAIASAKLYFYECGTTTPKTTYSDSALSTANANPLTADADGWFGEIWLVGGCHKVVLKTAALATVWTVDNYYPAQTDTSATLVATSASALAAFTATNSSTGDAISAANSGSGYAISATGGAGKAAISATGGSAAAAISATGGATSGNGAEATGGAPNGHGVVGYGTGTGYGVIGSVTAGTAGVYGVATSGIGVIGESLSSYACVCSADTTSPVRAALRLIPQDAEPSSPQEGDVYYNSTTHKLQVRTNAGWVDLH